MPSGTANRKLLPVTWFQLKTVNDIPKLMTYLVQTIGGYEVRPFAGKKPDGTLALNVSITGRGQSVVVNTDEYLVRRNDTGVMSILTAAEFTVSYQDIVIT